MVHLKCAAPLVSYAHHKRSHANVVVDIVEFYNSMMRCVVEFMLVHVTLYTL